MPGFPKNGLAPSAGRKVPVPATQNEHRAYAPIRPPPAFDRAARTASTRSGGTKTATLHASDGSPGMSGRVPRRPILRARACDTPPGATSAFVWAEMTATPIRMSSWTAAEATWSVRIDLRGEWITGWCVTRRSARWPRHADTTAEVASSAINTLLAGPFGSPSRIPTLSQSARWANGNTASSASQMSRTVTGGEEPMAAVRLTPASRDGKRTMHLVPVPGKNAESRTSGSHAAWLQSGGPTWPRTRDRPVLSYGPVSPENTRDFHFPRVPKALSIRFPAVPGTTYLSLLNERAKPLASAGVAQLAERLCLDLADALPGHLEVLPHFLQRVVRLLADAEPHTEDTLLPRGQGPEDLLHLLGEIDVDRAVHRGGRVLVLDEIPEVAVLLFPDGGFQRNRLLRDFEHLADFLEGNVHPLRDLLGGGLPPELLDQIAGGPDQLVDRLDHVHRDADRSRLVGDRPGDRLPDPPGGVGRKLVPPPVLELVDRLHQTDVPLLDEVEELQPPVGVFLGDRHHQAEVRLHQFALRLPGLAFALFHQPQRLGEIAGLQARLPLHAFPDPGLRLLDRVRVPPDLVADGLDLPLLQVDLLDRLLHFPVESAYLLLPLP